MPHSFTPGPWYVVEGRTHGSIEVFGGDTAIAEIWRRGDAETEKANAQLIAAAPELLAALRGLRDAFLGTSVEVQADAMRAARAAIAKAGG